MTTLMEDGKRGAGNMVLEHSVVATGAVQGTWLMGTENPIHKMSREEEKGRGA